MAKFLSKNSIRGLLTRSLYKLPIGSLLARCLCEGSRFVRACADLQEKCRAPRSRNACGHFTRTILCGNLKGKCRTLIPRPPFRVSLRNRNAHGHFTSHSCVFFSRKYANTACAVEMHMDISQEPFCVNLQKNAGRYGYHVDQTARLNTYRKNPLVWPHCLGNNIKNKTHLFHGI